MLNYTEKFLDVVLIDATYKRNRFNMPIVNAIGVSKFGKSILLAFALLNNEKSDSYKWVFAKLQEAWKKEPGCFISDESSEIISGFTKFYSQFKFVGIELTFTCRGLLCAWHLQRHLTSHFSGLSKKDAKLFDQVTNLPFFTMERKFDTIIESILDSDFVSQKQKDYFKKSLKRSKIGPSASSRHIFVLQLQQLLELSLYIVCYQII